MGVVLKGRLGEDESMFPQSGIIPAFSPDPRSERFFVRQIFLRGFRGNERGGH